MSRRLFELLPPTDALIYRERGVPAVQVPAASVTQETITLKRELLTFCNIGNTALTLNEFEESHGHISLGQE